MIPNLVQLDPTGQIYNRWGYETGCGLEEMILFKSDRVCVTQLAVLKPVTSLLPFRRYINLLATTKLLNTAK